MIELQDVVDQLNLGEMPPAEKKQPGTDEVRAVVSVLTQLIGEGHARLASTGGQTVLRRLNRREYLNTVGDLFGLNMSMFDPTTKFPRDPRIPEALYIVAVINFETKYGAGVEEQHQKALKLLEQKHPNSPWTAKAKSGDF